MLELANLLYYIALKMIKTVN